MKREMTKKEAENLIKRIEASGYVKDEYYALWDKEFDGYKIRIHVFDVCGWHASLRISASKSTEVSMWMETLESCRVRDIERMARKMLQYIGGFQKEECRLKKPCC
jgi:hypothetical protein